MPISSSVKQGSCLEAASASQTMHVLRGNSTPTWLHSPLTCASLATNCSALSMSQQNIFRGHLKLTTAFCDDDCLPTTTSVVTAPPSPPDR